jgi:hypothetical protein
MTVLESICEALKKAASFNQHELAAPLVILWTDEERMWADCIDPLRTVFPTLLTLGVYSPNDRSGPGVWLRYELEKYSGTDVPVIYLPGIGRSAFRNADQCPPEARHLFALQFQGQFWTHRNGKDWRPFSYLSSADGGLGLDVAGDQETKKAIRECLTSLLDVKVEALRLGRLEATDFRAIVTKDPARTILRWMGDPNRLRLELEGPKWTAFCAVCRDTYHFDPEKDGTITAAEKLTTEKGPWALVWERYREAPRAYSGVKDLLESLPPTSLFESPSEYRPALNRKAEEQLAADLLALSELPHKDALTKLKALGIEHLPRATWVWASLGESPLAVAILHLSELASIVESCGSPTTFAALADYYSQTGWKADRSVLRTLDAARSAAGTKAVTAAIRAIYLPWLERLAIHVQAGCSNYPTSEPHSSRIFAVEEGTVYVFADGLRFDVARCLEEKFHGSNASIEVAYSWSALPTVTATAKPAWMPLAAKLSGPLEGAGFESKEKQTGKALTHARFKQLLEEIGIFFLDSNDIGSATGCAWTECGCVDTYGHEQGAKLAWRIDEELHNLQQRILDLLQAGWKRVRVVTDHGWLMVPGGLPKVDLPKHLTASRWSRCAIPSPGAQHGFPLTPWFWDSAEAVVLAPGISCFVGTMEYAHGGLTVQESLIPSITVVPLKSAVKHVVVKDLKWVGMRLNVVFEGAEGLKVDVRSKVADEKSTFATSPVFVSADGQKTSILVSDDDALGSAAFLVVLDNSGNSIYKRSLIVGES